MHFFDSMNFFSGPAATRWAALFLSASRRRVSPGFFPEIIFHLTRRLPEMRMA
jgi:hypothetical protein